MREDNDAFKRFTAGFLFIFIFFLESSFFVFCCFQVTDDGCDILTAREGEASMSWDVTTFQR